jgi:multidrug efflux pump subunit AcrA (membrane-fusion protein)
MRKLIGFAKAIVLTTCGAGGALYYNHAQSAAGRHPAPAPALAKPVKTESRSEAVVCSGRVESVDGEVDVASQVAGRLAEVRVKEGDMVERGQVVAVIDGPRQAAELAVAEANVALARSKVKQLEAGTGKEEIQQALCEAESVDALLIYESMSLTRMHRLYKISALSADDYDRQRQRVEQLRRQRDGLRKRHEALKRGSLPQEIDVARSELALAEERVRRTEVERDLLLVRAPTNGKVLEVYRHQGDSVATDQPTVRMADTTRLRIRLEVDEANVARLRPGLGGTFRIRGATSDVGRLSLTTIIPAFGPKRLFNPDTSARYDTRILSVFCEPADSRLPLYLGQRVTASLATGPEPEGSSTPGGSRLPQTPALVRLTSLSATPAGEARVE